MFGSRVSLLVALALLQAASAIDVSKNKNIEVAFSGNDNVPKTDFKSILPDDRGTGFIGDLTIGRRYADESVFRRVVEFNNPTNMVQRTTLALTVNSGVVHYISAQNDPGSYAVVCDESSSLGSSRSNVNLRVAPNSKSTLTLVIAAH
ncbi:hypothetical protein KM043_002422 [Ampulex compressa]|nr:hypothetical protein KM043_002422 [Ampulex compressa]